VCRLVVAEGGEDVTIKVSDEGGGIPRSGMNRIWTYLYSTAKQPVEVDQVRQSGLYLGSAVLDVGAGASRALSRGPSTTIEMS
jgi:K+-sensing histidine kinase KdpD